MSDSDPLRPLAPPWLRPNIHAAMQGAYDRAVAAGCDPAAAVAAACAVLLARVTGLAPSPEGDGETPNGATMPPFGQTLPSGGAPRRPDDADIADLVAALSYALRFDARGKPRKGGWDHAADLAAEWLAEHLKRSNFVLLRRPPGAPHRAG